MKLSSLFKFVHGGIQLRKDMDLASLTEQLSRDVPVSRTGLAAVISRLKSDEPVSLEDLAWQKQCLEAFFTAVWEDPEKAVSIFLEEDLEELTKHHIVFVDLMDPRSPLLTLEELSRLTSEFLVFLTERESFLIGEGYAPIYFAKSRFFARSLSFLPYSRLPTDETHQLIRHAHSWLSPFELSSDPRKSRSALLAEMFRRVNERLNRHRLDENGLKNLRAEALPFLVEVLQSLVDYLESKFENDYIVLEIVRHLEKADAEMLRALEEVSCFYPSIPKLRPGYGLLTSEYLHNLVLSAAPQPVSVSRLLAFLGHCITESESRKYGRAREDLRTILGDNWPASYFDFAFASSEVHRHKLDRSLDHFWERHQRSEPFWSNFRSAIEPILVKKVAGARPIDLSARPRRPLATKPRYEKDELGGLEMRLVVSYFKDGQHDIRRLAVMMTNYAKITYGGGRTERTPLQWYHENQDSFRNRLSRIRKKARQLGHFHLIPTDYWKRYSGRS